MTSYPNDFWIGAFKNLPISVLVTLYEDLCARCIYLLRRSRRARYRARDGCDGYDEDDGLRRRNSSTPVSYSTFRCMFGLFQSPYLPKAARCQ